MHINIYGVHTEPSCRRNSFGVCVCVQKTQCPARCSHITPKLCDGTESPSSVAALGLWFFVFSFCFLYFGGGAEGGQSGNAAINQY